MAKLTATGIHLDDDYVDCMHIDIRAIRLAGVLCKEKIGMVGLSR
jgi:hypothetical protein